MFENEEDTPLWKEGKSVAYCETCFNEMMIMKRRGSSFEGQVILASTRPAPFHHAVGNEDITSNKPHLSTGSTETKTLKADGAAPLNSTSESNAAFNYSSRLK